MKSERTSVLRTALFTAFLVAAALVLSACATTGAPQRGAGIESSIRNSDAFRTHLQDENITIETRGDKVTLMGTVPDASYKFLAEEIAKSVAGVKSVDNRLEAVGGTPEKGTDPWIAAMVKAELMSHPTLNVVESDVYVRDGRVTLRGEAVNPAQRDLAGVYARDVEGVRDVVNDIRVTGPAGAAPQASAEPADDAAITTQVGTALEANRSTTDIDAVIVTSDGIVTVSGFADSQAQKDLVTKIIADIDGVKGVNNQLMVQEPAALVR